MKKICIAVFVCLFAVLSTIAGNPENAKLIHRLEKQLQAKIAEVGIAEEELPKPNPTTEEINRRNEQKSNGENLVSEEDKAAKRAARRAKKAAEAKTE